MSSMFRWPCVRNTAALQIKTSKCFRAQRRWLQQQNNMSSLEEHSQVFGDWSRFWTDHKRWLTCLWAASVHGESPVFRRMSPIWRHQRKRRNAQILMQVLNSVFLLVNERSEWQFHDSSSIWMRRQWSWVRTTSISDRLLTGSSQPLWHQKNDLMRSSNSHTRLQRPP